MGRKLAFFFIIILQIQIEGSSGCVFLVNLSRLFDRQNEHVIIYKYSERENVMNYVSL